MRSPQKVKNAHQEEHLRVLREGSASQTAKYLLENCGFAAAVHKNQRQVSIKFGSSSSDHN